MRKDFYFLKWTIGLLLPAFFLASCARKGSPDGGPKDITPPVLLAAYPDTFSTNVDTKIKEIVIEFDEYIILKDYVKNVLISPPVEPSPNFSPAGIADKEVKIEFNSELQPNTTYTINFGEAIQDNNEGNPYSYFTYVFSTGDFIDSLKLSGKLNYAAERKMPENLVVAMYKIDTAYNDSIILSKKPYYVAKVDSANQFNLNYLIDGDYQVIAFNDETPNMIFDAATEKLAFINDTIRPSEAGNLELNLFEPRKPYKFIEAKQNNYGRIDFVFEGKPDSIQIKNISQEFNSEKIYRKPNSDTLQYWFDPRKDTLTDKFPKIRFTLDNGEKIDTLMPVSYDNSVKHELKFYPRKKDYAPGKIYEMESNYPIVAIDSQYIKVIKDSVEINFNLEQKNNTRFALNFPINFESKYKIEALPGAITDIFGETNDTLQTSFDVKMERDYGHLNLNIANAPTVPFWLKLLKSDDSEVQTIYGNQTQYQFRNLLPGKYYFKIILDENGNGKYDTGNFFERKQPEKIYIYQTEVEVRAFWDMNETWVLGTTQNQSP